MSVFLRVYIPEHVLCGCFFLFFITKDKLQQKVVVVGCYSGHLSCFVSLIAS